MSSAKDLLLGLKPKVELVPDKDGNKREGVYVRVLTGADRFILEKKFGSIEKDNADVDVFLETTLKTACDAEGKLLFGEDDRAAVQGMPTDVLQDIFTHALKLNRMKGDEDVDEVKSSSETES